MTFFLFLYEIINARKIIVKLKSRQPMATKGDFGPRLSKIHPPTNENIRIPTYPANEYAPVRMPLVSLFKFFINIESQQTLSVTVVTTIATQTTNVYILSGCLRSQN